MEKNRGNERNNQRAELGERYRSSQWLVIMRWQPQGKESLAGGESMVRSPCTTTLGNTTHPFPAAAAFPPSLFLGIPSLRLVLPYLHHHWMPHHV